MKQQKLRRSGFILVEAAVGVVLFCILLISLLQGIGFIANQVAAVAHRHKALCAVSLAPEGKPRDGIQVGYAHAAVPWRQVTAQSGDQKVTVYWAGL